MNWDLFLNPGTLALLIPILAMVYWIGGLGDETPRAHGYDREGHGSGRPQAKEVD
jgi:hypothetical protein